MTVGRADSERPGVPTSRIDATLLAVLVGGGAGWVAATSGTVTGPAVLGVVLGAVVLLGGLLAVPVLLT